MKRSSVSVASIGATKATVVGRTRARSASSRPSRSVLTKRSPYTRPGWCGTARAGYAEDHDDAELHRARHEARRRPRGDHAPAGPAQRAQRPRPHPQARALERGRPELHRRPRDARPAGRRRTRDGRRRRGAHRHARRLPQRHTGRAGRRAHLGRLLGRPRRRHRPPRCARPRLLRRDRRPPRRDRQDRGARPGHPGHADRRRQASSSSTTGSCAPTWRTTTAHCVPPTPPPKRRPRERPPRDVGRAARHLPQRPLGGRQRGRRDGRTARQAHHRSRRAPMSSTSWSRTSGTIGNACARSSKGLARQATASRRPRGGSRARPTASPWPSP